MISSLCWVPKGAFKVVPLVAEPPTKEEIEEVLRTGILGRRGDDVEEEDEGMDVDGSPEEVDEVAVARTAAKALNQGQVGRVSGDVGVISNGIDELNMDDYDDEDDGIDLFGSGTAETYYPSNDMDPYLQKHGDDDDDDDDDDEVEDMVIRPTDFGIICARNEDEVSHLEVWIYEDLEDGDSNMYVHHDIILPAFPLCTAWTDCNLKGGDKGNFLAVGSMDPAIEIWDLDLIEEVQPSVVLGGVSKKKKVNKKVYKKDSHRDSVLGLAWNEVARNVLASASADKSVKLWDVSIGKCVASVKHHSDKVQSVAWNGSSPKQLLSGSFDKSVIMVDVESIDKVCNKWLVTADVECLAWDPHVDHAFVVSQENGVLQGFDIRSASDASSSGRPVFTLQGHDKAVTSMSYNPRKPNLLATGSTDKTVKLWDLSNNQPSCLASKNPKAGSIFSIAFSKDNPYLLAVGGHKGKLNIWDISSEPGMGDIVPTEQIRSIS